jgi:hypothetical protein
LIPSDFTVAVKSLPQKGRLYNTTDELRMLLWSHFEDLNQWVGDKYDKKDVNPHHNEVVSVYFGYKDYKSQLYLRQIGFLLKNIDKMIMRKKTMQKLKKKEKAIAKH